MQGTLDRRVSILLWSSNIWNFADGLLGPLFAVFAQRVGGNVLDIAWAWGVYLIVTGVFVILVGLISDRVSKLPLLFAGYVLTAVFSFCYLLVDTPLKLLLVQAGIGLSLALSNPTHFALLARYSHTPNVEGGGAVWGWADGRDKIAMGLAVFAGGIIVSTLSFRALFMAMGSLQVVSTLLLARLFYIRGR